MQLLFNIGIRHTRSFLVKVLLLIQLCAIIMVPELLLLFYLAQQFGKFTIVALVLTSSLLGLFLVTNSMSTLVNRMRRRFSNGSAPKKELSMLMLLMISGYLLITPGLIGFTLGILSYYTPFNIVLRNILYKKYKPFARALYYYMKISS